METIGRPKTLPGKLWRSKEPVEDLHTTGTKELVIVLL